MSKLSKQDKIKIYNLWKNYGLSLTELNRKYNIGLSSILYLVNLIERHSVAILDQPYTHYSVEYKEQAIK